MNSASPSYDVFFSYHSEDRDVVTRLAAACQARGLEVFLDRWYLTPGQDWQHALADALSHCRAVAICLGPNGMGSWQQREKGLALNRQGNEPDFPVIPVLLPGADHISDFLSLNTWVDMRADLDDIRQLDILINAIQSQPPGSEYEPEAERQIGTVLQTVNPYRSLRYFREEDAPFFFGRSAFIDKLADAVQSHSFVGVVGASGSGKSSLVRAGLIPCLRQGLGRHVWEVVTLVPGDRPLRALAVALSPLLEPETPPGIRNLENVGILKDFLERGENDLRDLVEEALKKQPGTDRLMLIVDQWEELYTLTADAEACADFIDQLLEATAKAPISVVFTLRGDFYGHALAHRSLADRLHNNVVNLGPMTRNELEEAMTKPAHAVRLSFEPGLVETILNDVGNEPGNLPLLEFAVTALWDDRQDGRLQHDAYQAMGRVKGAMANRAETLYDSLTPLEQEAAKRVFLRLVRLGEATEDTRRRARFAELGESSMLLIRQLAVVSFLSGNVSWVLFSPDQSIFLVIYYSNHSELWHSANGELLTPRLGEINQTSFLMPWGREVVMFSSDSSLFVVEYNDNRSELWELRDYSHRLAELGLSLDGAIIDQSHRRALVWYSDGRGYILDIDWLKAMEGKPELLSAEELMRFACQGPFASGLFQESALEPYLDGRSSKACQDTLAK